MVANLGQNYFTHPQPANAVAFGPETSQNSAKTMILVLKSLSQCSSMPSLRPVQYHTGGETLVPLNGLNPVHTVLLPCWIVSVITSTLLCVTICCTVVRGETSHHMC